MVVEVLNLRISLYISVYCDISVLESKLSARIYVYCAMLGQPYK